MNDPVAGTVLIAGLLGFFALVIVWAVRTNRQNKRRIKRLADMLGAVASGTRAAGVRDGATYRFGYSPPSSKRSPSTLTVSIDVPAGQLFQIVREGRAERLSKRIGLSAEIQTGDPAFDDEFYIETEAVEFTRTLLAQDAAREAVRAVFQLGFTAVRHDGQRLLAVWSAFKLRDDTDPSSITGAVAQLAALARQIPAVVPAPGRRALIPITAGGGAAWIALGIALLVGVAFLAGAAARFRPLDVAALLRDSLRYSMPALVVWLAVAILFLRGNSTAHKQLVFIVIASVFVFLLGGDAVETIFNGWADTAPPTAHEQEVVRTYSSSGRRTSYYVVVTSWRRRGQAENLVVSSTVYHAARPHRHLTVVTKPGRLGFEWIVSYAVAEPPR